MARTWAEVQDAGRRVERLAGQGWAPRLANVGYAARGVVYGVIGVLAARVAIGSGGRTTDSRGALEAVARAPFGKAILVALGVGFAALACWYVFLVFVDPSAARQGPKAILSKLGKLVAAVAHGSLALASLRLVSGRSAGASSGQQAEGFTARALALPAGRVLVLLVAAIFLLAAARRVSTGLKRDFMNDLETARMDARLRAWAARLGAAGLTAQGVLFGVVGALLGWAAYTHEPSKATGLDGALRTVASQPAGMTLLGLVALGLLAYAAYSFIEARYRRPSA